MKRHDRGDEVFKELDEYIKDYPDFLLNGENWSEIKSKDNIVSFKKNAYPQWVQLSYVVSTHSCFFGVSWQQSVLVLHGLILTSSKPFFYPLGTRI